MTDSQQDNSSVRVATRIRPQLPREIIDACKVCITKTPGEPQTWLGSNKAFTFDYVYDTDSTQDSIYNDTVHDLIEGCFEGYNATVLAYGQTGSGKTYTMGTGFELAQNAQQQGIIPRAVKHLFDGIRNRQEEATEKGQVAPEFKVSCQFLELYNEEILDLFDTASCVKNGKAGKSGIRIHEDSNGNIYTMGVATKNVHSEEETLQCLKSGAFNRTTGSTNMNDSSSRSHAIFTIYLQQQRQSVPENPFHLEGTGDDEASSEMNGEAVMKPPAGDFETLSAKFHFVDLAGSERLKRTGATGNRAKEGISINCGLLALGNVISALGDASRKVSHVPYRDSKLTRLLQDSLGGNSRTLMIACVSPSDRDFMETLNTLKYANRARNIKNKVTANQDKTSRTILMLRQEIQNLQLELMEYKQGKRIVGADGEETTNDMFHENSMLTKENHNLRTRIKAMQETIDVLTAKNSQLLAEKEVGNWIQNGEGGASADMTAMVENYMKEIEQLRSKLCESENMCEQLRKESAKVKRMSMSTFSPAAKINNLSMTSPGMMDLSVDGDSGYSVQELIQMAKKEIEKKKEQKRARKSSKLLDEDKDANSAEEDEDDEEDNTDDSGDDGDSESETESDNNQKSGDNSEFNEELVELTSEISLKQRLIEELETSQKRMQAMKQQYENKLMELQNKISVTEEERDRVLKNMGGAKGSAAPEKMQKVKQDYQEKLEKLQSEVKKLQTAKKEHAKLLRSQGQYERQIEKLKSEVNDMKRSKVKLVQKMKEESSRHREQELKRNKELSQMRKQTRKNESKIKSLEAEKRMKDNILKRKTEEVSALRRNQRKISLPHGKRHAASGRFSEKAAKSKWQTIEHRITKIALNKQAIAQMENDMDRWLKEREKLSRKLERMVAKRKRLLQEKGDSSLVEDLDDQIENIKANVNYLHENIVECQQNIVEMEQAENPEEEDEESVAKIINITDMNLEESKYFLSKLLSMTVNQCCQATQKEGRVRELENKISQIQHQSTLHQQLLQHMIEQQDLEIYDLMLANEHGENDSDEESENDEVLPMSANLNLEASEENGQGSDSSFGRKEKARRKRTTKEDLLFNDFDLPQPMSMPSALSNADNKQMKPSALGSSSSFQRSLSFTKPSSDLLFRSRSFVKPTGGGLGMNGRQKIPNQQFLAPSHPSMNPMAQSVDQSSFSRLSSIYQPSPLMSRRQLDPQRSSMRRISSSTAKLNEQELSSSPPGSPPTFRRLGSRDESGVGKNVFHRLVAGTNIGTSKTPDKGVINPYRGRIAPKNPLICSSVAEGHTKAVLSVFATDDLLFSGSKDRTVKVWDLNRKEEIQSLTGHPNNVLAVRYSKASRLAFTVSSAFIKVWDLRLDTSSGCIKTLSSSGLTTNGSIQANPLNRALQLPPGESIINDIALSPSGYGLFSAAADKVRIWDLRKFHSIGKLSGGHQAAVMCLTTGSSEGNDGDIVVTGSKDHYVKVFSVPESKGGVYQPTINLDPPHYDGIECLALNDDILFSASRDTCIKKWNLKNQELVRSINNAHKDWICGLSFLPGAEIIVSGCRSGYIKLWSVESCSLRGEMKAHNSTINTITTNNNHIFTGSNDGSIGIWRVKSNFDRSPDSDTS